MKQTKNAQFFPGLRPQSRRLVCASLLALVASVSILPAKSFAIDLLTGLGGPANYGTLAMNPNDDGSSSRLNLPFTINFFGSSYSSFWINNNGNLTFNSPLGSFTPTPFPVSNQPMIAAYWGDVDTRGTNGGAVYVGAPNADTIVATWDRVGYFNSQSNLLNSFQTVLRNRPDTGAGNFDIEFRYLDLEWTTGSASGGIGGLGGTPAQAGYDAGDGTNFLTLPGSRTAAVLDLQNTSNVSLTTPGLWSLAVRNGLPPGSHPGNPYLPVVVNGEFKFDFNVQLGQRVFIDPIIAVGYDYFLDSGPLFSSVLLPTGVGDDIYDLWLWDAILMEWYDSTTDIIGGTPYSFANSLDRFRILGIETSAGLDPSDVLAFVTGLTFNGSGPVSMRQVPIVAIPEPTNILVGWSLCAVVGFTRAFRRRMSARIADHV